MQRRIWRRAVIAIGALALLYYAPVLLFDFLAWYQAKTFAFPNLEYPSALVLERSNGEGVDIAMDVRVEGALNMATSDEREKVLQYYTEHLSKQGWTIEQQSSDTLSSAYTIKRLYSPLHGQKPELTPFPSYGLEIKLLEEAETTIIKIAYFRIMHM